MTEPTTIVAAHSVAGTRSLGASVLTSRLRWMALALLSFAGAIEAVFARHTMNPDGICYLDMGDAMWRGDWHVAINGYWSPLYPWLEGLALKVFHPGAYSQYSVVHFVNFLIYLVALCCFDFLLRSAISRTQLQESVTNASCLPDWAVFLVGYAIFFWASISQTKLETVSPDMLMAALLYLAAAVLLTIRAEPQRLSRHIFLGAILGVGFLAKAPFFPMAFVFLAISFVLVRNWRIATPRVGTALLVFLAISSIWIIPLSRSKGRLTFGDSAKVNYVLWVNGASPTYYFVTLGTAGGHYLHPLRQILDAPPVYEFATPMPGTLPIWYDASYWAEGAIPRLLPRRQLATLKENISFYLNKLFNVQAPLAAGFLILSFMADKESFRRSSSALWPVWLIGIVGLGMYAVVHVELRYIAVLFTMFWLALFSGLKVPGSPLKRRIASFILLGVALGMAVPTAISVSRDLVHIKGPPHRTWRLAEDLRTLGVRPGDRVARIGGRFGTVYWARLLGVTVVAEVPLAHAKDFWNASPQVQTEVIRKFQSLGVKAIVGDMTNTNEIFTPGPQWVKLGTDGKFYALAVPSAKD